jgi:hypothetical protein
VLTHSQAGGEFSAKEHIYTADSCSHQRLSWAAVAKYVNCRFGNLIL